MRKLLEAAPDGVLLLEPRTRKITDVNPAISELLGYPRDELLGKELWQVGLVKDADTSRAILEQVGGAGQVWQGTLTVQTKRGERREVEFVSNLDEENGQPAIQCTIHDITGRKQVERELTATLEREQAAYQEAVTARAQFRALFESAPGLYIVLAPEDFRIIAVSNAYLKATMTAREQIMGRSLFNVFPDNPDEPWADGTRNLRASLERVRTTGQADVMAVQRYPVRRPPEQGGGFEERYWSPVNSPVFGARGKLAYIIHKVEDVTEFVHLKQKEGRQHEEGFAWAAKEERMEAEIVLRAKELQELNERLRASEAQLRAANRELDSFAAMVSHDLKEPLRGIGTIATWLQQDYADKLDDAGRARLADISKRVRRMSRMISDILEFSRLGRSEDGTGPVPLAELVPSVVEALVPPDQVRVEVAPGLPVVRGEAVRLRQVFQNLIANAIQHNDKPHIVIAVNWTDAGECWELSVADNGPGIEPCHFETIFEMFQTLEPKRKTDSAGVGLALVKRIVEHAGGRVWIESRVGEGSAFHFTWPKVPAAATTEDRSRSERLAA
jgi:PAS domain S-box-containing protein